VLPVSRHENYVLGQVRSRGGLVCQGHSLCEQLYESWGLFRDQTKLEQSFLKVAVHMTQIHFSEFLHPGFGVSSDVVRTT